jgi:uncharacterized linocin/CFP29 family protein
MADDASPLPWTPQQWATLRSVARESARKSRVASGFLPLAGPVPAGDSTVPANWIDVEQLGGPARGIAKERLETRSGRTLQLVTVACNLYLRGSEIADPNLDAVKSLVRRAGEVIGRVEDAVIFRGLDKNHTIHPRTGALAGDPVVKPEIYTISGGNDFIGLLGAPDTLDELRQQQLALNAPALGAAAAAAAAPKDEMIVHLAPPPALAGPAGVAPANAPRRSPIVTAVIEAVQRLENHGHFGPFAVVFGHEHFEKATEPTNDSLVLPIDRISPFLEGGPILRSGSLDNAAGIVVALGGSPVELVLGCDIDLDYVQRTLEPRHVVRVYERFALRIKELDAVCKILG